MIIARQKRKENICEYLLYMWQVEDLIRANHFDMDEIRDKVIARYNQPDEVKEEIARWYEELIEMMRSEGVKESGHIQWSSLLQNASLYRTVACQVRRKRHSGTGNMLYCRIWIPDAADAGKGNQC